MANPEIIINQSNILKASRNKTGDLTNSYSPFQNLTSESTELLGDFTTEKLNFDLEHPVDIITQDNYDGSVNLILNDGKNTPKLINSKFSIQNDSKFLIPDHYGYKDTNIYEEIIIGSSEKGKFIQEVIKIGDASIMNFSFGGYD